MAQSPPILRSRHLRCPRPTSPSAIATYEIYRINALADRFDVGPAAVLDQGRAGEPAAPRGRAGRHAADIEAVAGWGRHPERHGFGGADAAEIAFTPERVLMQDFTGVPGVVDLAAMRDALGELGGDPAKVNPLVPVELVIDHSVIAEVVGHAGRLRRERGHRVPAQHRALPAAALGPAGLRRVPGGAAGHGHLPPGQPRVPVPGGLRHRRRPGLLRHPGGHRLPHHHGQRARRARLGGRAASRPRRPCSASRCPCSSRRWWASG